MTSEHLKTIRGAKYARMMNEWRQKHKHFHPSCWAQMHTNPVQSLNHNYPSNQQPRLCRHPWNTYFWGMLRCFKQAVSLMARLHDKAGTIGRWRRCLERTSTACKVPRLAAVSCCHGLCRLIWAKDGTSQGARVWLVIYGHTSEAQRSLPTLDWTGCKSVQNRI